MIFKPKKYIVIVQEENAACASYVSDPIEVESFDRSEMEMVAGAISQINYDLENNL